MNLDELRDLVDAGYSDSVIAEHFGVSSRTVLRRRKAHGIASNWTPPTRHNYYAGCRCDECVQSNRDHEARARQRAQRATALAASHNEPWTPDADDVVLSDITVRAAALILGRTYCAVSSRRKRLRRLAGGAATS